MKKIGRANELLWVFGILFVALGVTFCSKADLGVSMIAAPAFIVSEALSSLLPFFSVGVTEYAIQAVLLMLLCIIVRHFNLKYLSAFLVAIIYGYTLDLFLWIFGNVTFDGILLRYIMLIVGDIITAFGVACFFRTYMPLQVYELFVAETADRFKLNLGKMKWAFDISLLVVSLILAFTLFGDAAAFDITSIGETCFHSLGLGTLITTLINSPLITLTGRLIDRIFEPTPRFQRLEKLLKR